MTGLFIRLTVDVDDDIAMALMTTSRIQIQEKAEERRWQKWEEKTTLREREELKYWGECKDKDKDKDKDKYKDKDRKHSKKNGFMYTGLSSLC